ncbi:MAG: butyrate kinase [Mucinivorans sp.]
MSEMILAINPGSTSTKIAVFDGENLVFESNIHHSNQDLSLFDCIVDQFDFRKQAIEQELVNHSVSLMNFDVIVGRGGLIYPICSGTYPVNDAMKRDLVTSPVGEHASNLGGLIADEIARQISKETGRDVIAYIADPVVVDEMDDVARITGLPIFQRKSVFHALNHKSLARIYADKMGRKYEDMNMIITHLGGGISVAAHRHGMAIDVNNTLDGQGPFTPERSGTLPVGDLVKLCYSGKYTYEQMKKLVKGEGGFVAHLGTNDTQQVLRMVENGDQHAELILDALCYNIAKEIGAMSVVLHGEVDVIIITGGMAHSKEIVDRIMRRVDYIAPVIVYAGQNEMNALRDSVLGVLRGTITPKIYAPDIE